jgi:sugar/nucleoside kinase (ribokinase family)
VTTGSESSASAIRQPRRLGVLGTLVWDRIHRKERRGVPVEEWGGIAYALGALAAALDPSWTIRPILKVGRDLSEEALRFLRAIPRLEADVAVRVVPEPNNRVELHYLDEERRTERLSGGVPPWTWLELEPLLASCDALYVNFISGFEMELDTALSLRRGYGGPIYADLHSLFLGVGRKGDRVPRELPGWAAWLRCFDAIQMNEDEFELLGKAWGDPWRLAADVVNPQLKLITVTLGTRGAAYVAGPSFEDQPLDWPRTRKRIGAHGPSRSARVPPARVVASPDPTGCGDVWGATLFARLLSGEPLDVAMETANALAGRNAESRGAQDLHLHLSGRISALGRA